MSLHYHGTPITPRVEILRLAGRHFCVSFADPRDVKVCHELGQSVMLDNGAFSFWRAGNQTNWPAYYEWCAKWLDYQTTWAIIPDVIDGGEDANDALIEQWPHGTRGAPVWHLHEPIGRLLRLCGAWPRVCLGSSGEYRQVGTERWHDRMTDAMNQLCGNGPAPVWLHMLRGMSLSGSHYPFASVDSTDVAQNFHIDGKIVDRAQRWDAVQCPARWTVRPVQMEMAT